MESWVQDAKIKIWIIHQKIKQQKRWDRNLLQKLQVV